jgi:Uma2 family endonuclease
MDTLNLSLKKRYSYADYLTWLDDKRRELFNGFINLMTPAPAMIHQEISGAVFGFFWMYLQNKPCKVFSAPFDVRLPKEGLGKDNKKIFTVVQPDITIVCDMNKLDEKGCIGAPDIIVEIISPSTAKKDLNDKFEIYEESGVKEYWVVYPSDKAASVFKLESNGKYDDGTLYKSNSKINTRILPDFEIDLKEIFPD